MAKLTGSIQFTGSLDNLSAYKKRGSDKIILRRKGGASKERIKKDPQFALTRQNNDEFSGRAKAGAAIRKALHALKQLEETHFTAQVNSMMSVIQNLDTVNERGQRSISISQHRYLLEGFNLNRELLFNTVMRHPVACTLSRDNGSARISMPAILPGINFYTPPPYQLYRFIMVMGVVSDMEYSATGYRPVNPVKYNAAEIYTGWYSGQEQITAQQFDLQLNNFSGLADSDSLLLAIGIEFGYPVTNTITRAVKYAGAASILATG